MLTENPNLCACVASTLVTGPSPWLSSVLMHLLKTSASSPFSTFLLSFVDEEIGNPSEWYTQLHRGVWAGGGLSSHGPWYFMFQESPSFSVHCFPLALLAFIISMDQEVFEWQQECLNLVVSLLNITKEIACLRPQKDLAFNYSLKPIWCTLYNWWIGKMDSYSLWQCGLIHGWMNPETSTCTVQVCCVSCRLREN